MVRKSRARLKTSGAAFCMLGGPAMVFKGLQEAFSPANRKMGKARGRIHIRPLALFLRYAQTSSLAFSAAVAASGVYASAPICLAKESVTGAPPTITFT